MYQQLRTTVEADFVAVNKFIVEQLHSSVPLVEDIGNYIVEAGGKRLRPLLVLLVARGCKLHSEQHIPMAAVIEFIHTATLLHDDVVDLSTLRRGRPTVNAEWDNPSSVLVGDFIYSRAFQVLVEIGDMRIMRIMADTTNRIAEGEVLQLIAKSNPDADELTYMQVIQSKTAILFQAAAQCGAILGGAVGETEAALTHFGMHLGVAYQLIDDLLDYTGDTQALGKNVGDDLAEGKPTLPLIRAMQQAGAEDRALLRASLSAETVSEENLRQVISIIRRSDGLDYTRGLAMEQAAKARACLDVLAASKYRDALEQLVAITTDRDN